MRNSIIFLCDLRSNLIIVIEQHIYSISGPIASGITLVCVCAFFTLFSPPIFDSCAQFFFFYFCHRHHCNSHSFCFINRCFRRSTLMQSSNGRNWCTIQIDARNGSTNTAINRLVYIDRFEQTNTDRHMDNSYVAIYFLAWYFLDSRDSRFVITIGHNCLGLLYASRYVSISLRELLQCRSINWMTIKRNFALKFTKVTYFPVWWYVRHMCVVCTQ